MVDWLNKQKDQIPENALLIVSNSGFASLDYWLHTLSRITTYTILYYHRRLLLVPSNQAISSPRKCVVTVFLDTYRGYPFPKGGFKPRTSLPRKSHSALSLINGTTLLGTRIISQLFRNFGVFWVFQVPVWLDQRTPVLLVSSTQALSKQHS